MLYVRVVLCLCAFVCAHVAGWRLSAVLYGPQHPHQTRAQQTTNNNQQPTTNKQQTTNNATQPGRTGRAGAKGTAYSFFTAANGRLARDIVKVMAEASQEVPPALQQLASTAGGGGGGGGGFRGGGRGRGGGRRW